MRKILYIEDDPSIRANVAELLTIKGYDVSMAANGKEGISQAKHIVPDLILCDMLMPDLNGLQVLEAIRSTSGVSHIPFLLLTAQVDTLALQHQSRLEANDYLAKPFQLKDLLRAINSLMQKFGQLESTSH